LAVANKSRPNRQVKQQGLQMVAFQVFGAVMVMLSLGTMMSNDLRRNR
jgi:hypothetical protein